MCYLIHVMCLLSEKQKLPFLPLHCINSCHSYLRTASTVAIPTSALHQQLPFLPLHCTNSRHSYLCSVSTVAIPTYAQHQQLQFLHCNPAKRIRV
jgi:hypothetical protein